MDWKNVWHGGLRGKWCRGREVVHVHRAVNAQDPKQSTMYQSMAEAVKGVKNKQPSLQWYLWRHLPAARQTPWPSSRSSRRQPDSSSLSLPGEPSTCRPLLHGDIHCQVKMNLFYLWMFIEIWYFYGKKYDASYLSNLEFWKKSSS